MMTRFLPLCTLMVALPVCSVNAMSPEELVRNGISLMKRS